MGVPTPPFKGACLCGAVKIDVRAPALLTFVCHCTDCQKLSAGPYSLSTMFAADSFSHSGKVLQGGLGTGMRSHYFCASCLCFIYSQVGADNPRINLRTSLLENAADFVPFVALMTEEKMPWSEVAAPHSFARHPETAQALQALMAAYAAQ